MLDNKTIKSIRSIIFRFLDPKKDKAFIFGSRAWGNSRKFSDIDIGIETKRKINISEIEEAFEDSNLPYKVEIVNFANVSKKFRRFSLKKIIPLNQK